MVLTARIAGLAACLLVFACSPQLESGKYACKNGGACPDGQTCDPVDSLCKSPSELLEADGGGGDASGGGSGTGASGTSGGGDKDGSAGGDLDGGQSGGSDAGGDGGGAGAGGADGGDAAIGGGSCGTDDPCPSMGGIPGVCSGGECLPGCASQSDCSSGQCLDVPVGDMASDTACTTITDPDVLGTKQCNPKLGPSCEAPAACVFNPDIPTPMGSMYGACSLRCNESQNCPGGPTQMLCLEVFEDPETHQCFKKCVNSSACGDLTCGTLGGHQVCIPSSWDGVALPLPNPPAPM